MNDPEATLLDLLKEHALKLGDFTLKSGRQSSYLIDCKKVVLTGVGHRLVGEVMYDHAIRGYDVAAVAGVELGGCPLASAVACHSAAFMGAAPPPLDVIYVRKERKGHGSKSLLETGWRLGQGAKVVVLEDVATTGGSAMFAVEQLWKYGFDVLRVCALVDRLEGAGELFEKQGIRFNAVFTPADFGQ